MDTSNCNFSTPEGPGGRAIRCVGKGVRPAVDLGHVRLAVVGAIGVGLPA